MFEYPEENYYERNGREVRMHPYCSKIVLPLIIIEKVQDANIEKQ